MDNGALRDREKHDSASPCPFFGLSIEATLAWPEEPPARQAGC